MGKPLVCIENVRSVHPPTADTEEFAAQGDRLMLYYLPHMETVEFRRAPKGVLTAGWVVGVFIEEMPDKGDIPD